MASKEVWLIPWCKIAPSFPTHCQPMNLQLHHHNFITNLQPYNSPPSPNSTSTLHKSKPPITTSFSPATISNIHNSQIQTPMNNQTLITLNPNRNWKHSPFYNHNPPNQKNQIVGDDDWNWEKGFKLYLMRRRSTRIAGRDISLWPSSKALLCLSFFLGQTPSGGAFPLLVPLQLNLGSRWLGRWFPLLSCMDLVSVFFSSPRACLRLTSFPRPLGSSLQNQLIWIQLTILKISLPEFALLLLEPVMTMLPPTCW